MKQTQGKPRPRFIRAAPFISIFGALAFVVFVCVWGVWTELAHRRSIIYGTAVSESRSHAERSVIRIEMELDDGKSILDFQQPNVPKWLSRHWEHAIVGKSDRLYSAVCDLQGHVLSSSTWLVPSHSAQDDFRFPTDSLSEGKLDFGPNVHEYKQFEFVGGRTAIDVSVPIQHSGATVGYYRAGLDKRWLEERVSEAQSSVIRGWLGIIVAVALTLLVSSLSLYRLGVHTIQLEQELGMAEAKRLSDLSRLIVGMAHELRNPLNAVRLNLFTSEKLIRGESQMLQDDAVAMLRESVSEVERVEDLIGQLLGYARIESEEFSWIDLNKEIASVLHFLQPMHAHSAIEADLLIEQQSVEVFFDRKRLRQILLNLLQNARQAMPQGGKLRIHVIHAEDRVQVRIDDSGPGIPADQYERIFEPFFTTRHEGVGLGLAVVRSLVERAQGSIICRRSQVLGGMCFELEFPARRNANLPTVTMTTSDSNYPSSLERYEHNTVHSRR